jgi:hypothetical protein
MFVFDLMHMSHKSHAQQCKHPYMAQRVVRVVTAPSCHLQHALSAQADSLCTEMLWSSLLHTSWHISLTCHTPCLQQYCIKHVHVHAHHSSSRGCCPLPLTPGSNDPPDSCAMVSASTRTPLAMCCALANSSGRWLQPLRQQGIKIMPVGATLHGGVIKMV